MESANVCLPLLGKIYFWNSRFGSVLTTFLVELWRGTKMAGKPLMLPTFIHTILLGSDKPTLHAYLCPFLLPQCLEIVDTANAMDGSVYARWLHGGCMSVCSAGTDFVAHPPPPVPILDRGRQPVLACRGMQNLSRCHCSSRRTGFESKDNKG